MNLRRKSFIKRLPRKIKKKIKRSLKGIKNYADWLNEAINFIATESNAINFYHKNIKDDITEELIKEIILESKKLENGEK